MLEIRPAGAKGFGIFATRPIARGTRILAERPLLTVRREGDVFEAAARLSRAQWSALSRLSINPVRRSDVLGWTQAVWHAVRFGVRGGGDGDGGSPPKSEEGEGGEPARAPKGFWTRVEDYGLVLQVFRNNNFDLGNGSQAVFDRVSRLNHSCVPSAQGNFNSASGEFTVHAVRDVRVGEEVTVNYLVEHAGLRGARQGKLLDGYGFLCDCEVCDERSARGKESEERRVRMRMALSEFAEQGVGDVAKELEVTEALIELFETEGIRGRELGTMYLSAAELCTKLDMRAKAKALAERGLKIDEECIGLDNPLYRESVERVRTGVGL